MNGIKIVPVKAKEKKLKRVSFLLNNVYYKKLKQIATSKSVSISALLRDYLVNPIDQIHSHNGIITSDKQTTITIRIVKEAWDNLVSKAKDLQISTSDLIRLAIIEQVTKNVSMTNKTLIAKGHYREYLDTLNRPLADYNIVDLLTILKVSIDVCDFEIASKTIKLLKSKLNPKEDKFAKLKLKSLEIDYYINSGELDKALKKISAFQKESDLIEYRGLLGLTYVQKAEIVGYADYFEEAYINFQKALDYLDVRNFPAEMVRVYVRYPLIMAFESNFSYAQRYLEKLHSIVKNYDNKYFRGWYELVKTILAYLQNDLETAEQSVKQALDFFNIVGAKHEIYYCNDLLGRIYTSADDYPKARDYLAKALKMLPSTAPSYSFLFLKFIEAKNNYKDSINEILTFQQKFPDFCPNMASYLLHTTELIHGRNQSERLNGETGLLHLLEKGEYTLIKEACKNTLATRKLYPIR